MSSEKTAQVAAEEHAAQIWRMEPYGAESDSEKDFLTGVTWAKKHDPDVLSAILASEVLVSACIKEAEFRNEEPITIVKIAKEKLESYRKGCL